MKVLDVCVIRGLGAATSIIYPVTPRRRLNRQLSILLSIINTKSSLKLRKIECKIMGNPLFEHTTRDLLDLVWKVGLSCSKKKQRRCLMGGTDFP